MLIFNIFLAHIGLHSLPILLQTRLILRPFNKLFLDENAHLFFCRCHRSDILHMAGRQASFFTTLFFISFVFREIASQQCHGINSIYQMMLKGHTYKTFKTTPGTPECRDICLADERCQSFNVVMFIAICELNNRTKEARPEDFVIDEYRYYMAKGPKRGN